ncbi:MAG: hypothetical protein ACAI37_07905 [Chthoniobacter sp.]
MSQMTGLKYQLTRQTLALTAADVRKNLLYLGTKTPGKLSDRDDAVVLGIDLRGEEGECHRVPGHNDTHFG